MKTTVNFFRIVGGKQDGAVSKLRQPMELDASEVKHIRSDGEQYTLRNIEGDTAVLVHDAVRSNDPSSATRPTGGAS